MDLVLFLYKRYTWPLMERILDCELALANKVDKPKRKSRGRGGEREEERGLGDL